MPSSIYFLSEPELRFYEALCEAVVPKGEDENLDPGALTVGAISYIDSSMVEAPKEFKDYYRESVRLVNERSKSEFSKEFAELKEDDKDRILRELFLDPLTRERVFDLRSLALEGFYSDYHDPSYSGITAWQYVEFSGKRISDLKKDWSFLKVWKDATSK